jgi:hypothetical protein
MENITFWQVFATIWFTTWYTSVLGTWKYIKYNLEDRAPYHLMTQRKYLHFLVYSVCINFLLPFVGIQLAFSDKYRERWVMAYVAAIIKKK